MPQLKKRRVLGFQIETTPGTAETIIAGECIWVTDPVVQFDVPMNERHATGSLSRITSVSGARSGKVTFGVELAAIGDAEAESAKPEWADLLLACGMVEDGETDGLFKPTSNSADYKTVTISVYQDGILKTLAGAMGTYTLEGTTGNPGKINFEFTGLFVSPTDATMLALPAYPNKPPRFAGATFTIGGTARKIASLNLSANNTIKLVEDITNSTGYSRALVTDRNYSGSIDPESRTIATEGIWAAWIGGTEAALSLIVGSGTNGIVTISAPKLQYTNVQEGDRDGLVVNNSDFQLNATGADAPDTEVTIAFS